jgi:hypothetical protein
LPLAFGLGGGLLLLLRLAFGRGLDRIDFHFQLTTNKVSGRLFMGPSRVWLVDWVNVVDEPVGGQKVTLRLLEAAIVPGKGVSRGGRGSGIARRKEAFLADHVQEAISAEFLVAVPETKPTGLVHVETEPVAFFGSPQAILVLAQDVGARLLLVPLQLEPVAKNPTSDRLAQGHGVNELALCAAVGIPDTHRGSL